jgi:hypothetical protein
VLQVEFPYIVACANGMVYNVIEHMCIVINFLETFNKPWKDPMPHVGEKHLAFKTLGI